MLEFNSGSKYHYISGKMSALVKKILNKTPYNLGTYQFAEGRRII